MSWLNLPHERVAASTIRREWRSNMSERPPDAVSIPRDEIEILPAEVSEQQANDTGARVWISLNANQGNHRVYHVKPGPIGSILLAIAFGALLAVAIVALLSFLALFAVLACISAVTVLAIVVYGRLTSHFRQAR
jgi:hypothetical protein